MEKVSISEKTTMWDPYAEAERASLVTHFPKARFTESSSRTIAVNPRPQVVAHRGYTQNATENTMAAFEAAFQTGMRAFETDVHLTNDGVLMLSHDATLKRCFGVDRKIADCDWSVIKRLKSIKFENAPARLDDLLDWMATGPRDYFSVWLFIDIKTDDDSSLMMAKIAKAIHSIRPTRDRPWNERIVLGCWKGEYIPLCHEYLPGFPISYIGYFVPAARHFMKVPNIAFNMNINALMLPFGKGFIRDAKAAGHPVYAWTVNKPVQMAFCIENELDCVFTDNPEGLKASRSFSESSAPTRLAARAKLSGALLLKFFLFLFFFIIATRRGAYKIDQQFAVRK